MKESITVRPDKDRLINILEDIKRGRIKIPLFQREFVWKDKQMIDLFDSMEKGYPIGSLLFWKPQEEYKYFENFGPYKIKEKANDVKYVLDGFQRLSTLFGVLTNPYKYNEANNSTVPKDYLIHYDLFEQEFTYTKKRLKDYSLIPLYVLIDTFDFLSFISDLKNDVPDEETYSLLVNRAKNLVKTFVDYEIPYIDIKGGDITSSVDIFSRINSTGTRISTDWMVSALSYNPNAGFLFTEKIEEFLSELEPINYENLSREAILHCIESASGKAFFDVKAEDLARQNNFPEIVLKSFDNIKKAISFLREEVNVIEYRLLPYNTQLIFLTEFFRINPYPDLLQIEKLKEWFWITSYSNYFTLYSLSKQRKALAQFKDFASGLTINPVYYHDQSQVLSTSIFPEKLDFGSVRSKTLMLFMLNYTYRHEHINNDFPTLDMRFLIPNVKSTGSLVITKSNDYNIPNQYQEKRSDAKFLLEGSCFDHDRYFVNEKVRHLFWSGAIDEMMNSRLQFIMNEERNFVETLRLSYTTLDSKETYYRS